MAELGRGEGQKPESKKKPVVRQQRPCRVCRLRKVKVWCFPLPLSTYAYLHLCTQNLDSIDKYLFTELIPTFYFVNITYQSSIDMSASLV